MTILLITEKYIEQYQNLKQHLSLDVVLTKIHRNLIFNIDLNIELTKQSDNDLGNFFDKFSNNTVFGKTMKNVRKHRDVKLVTTW